MKRIATAFGMALLVAAAHADDTTTQSKNYDERLQNLEHQLQQLQSESGNKASSANAFNPALSVILGGTYRQFTRDPAQYALPGFALNNEAGPGTRGLSLGESELGISANVDNLFFGNLIASIAPEGGINVEEGYFQTTALPHGLVVKTGRFFSGVGYLNEQHAHVWDFVDVPLPYRAILGNQYNDDGVQVRWLAPTDQFIELGVDVYRGDHFPAGGAANHGRGTRTLFAHTGGDVGDSHSWRLGLSQLHAKADARETGNPIAPDTFTGTSRVDIADFEWKWSPHGNPTVTHVKFQTEVFRRTESGTFDANDYSGTQRGWYAQAVYQFMPRWRTGIRHDQVDAENPGAAFAGTALDPSGVNPHRNSVMIDFSNSEFSRLRLQYNVDHSRATTDRQWYLQYLMSIGAHGAHSF